MNNYLTLFAALVITCVAEYFSIIGLTTIFVGAYYPVIIMGVAMALGKIVATSWLYRNWIFAPATVKYYLIVAIIILMTITTLGTFGYLSKAHLDQGIVSGDAVAKLEIFDAKIKFEKDNVEANLKVLKQMDDAVDQILGRTTTETGADKAVALRRSQQKERSRIQNEISQSQKSIAELNDARAPVAAEVRKVEAEVGPLKYIAELIYGNSDQNVLDKSVRWMIILIALVLDPLAIALLIAFNHGDRPQTLIKKKKATRIELDKNSILKL